MNSLEGTNRIVIKLIDGSKFVITRGYVEDEPAMILRYPRDAEILVNVKDDGEVVKFDLADDSNLSFVKSMRIENGMVSILTDVLTNVSIINYSDYDEEPDYSISTYEPEEKNVGFTVDVPIKNVQKIYADPILLAELLNNGVIEADDRVLKEYSIAPKFILYDCKNKTKKYIHK